MSNNAMNPQAQALQGQGSLYPTEPYCELFVNVHTAPPGYIESNSLGVVLVG